MATGTFHHVAVFHLVAQHLFNRTALSLSSMFSAFYLHVHCCLMPQTASSFNLPSLPPSRRAHSASIPSCLTRHHTRLLNQYLKMARSIADLLLLGHGGRLTLGRQAGEQGRERRAKRGRTRGGRAGITSVVREDDGTTRLAELPLLSAREICSRLAREEAGGGHLALQGRHSWRGDRTACMARGHGHLLAAFDKLCRRQ